MIIRLIIETDSLNEATKVNENKMKEMSSSMKPANKHLLKNLRELRIEQQEYKGNVQVRNVILLFAKYARMYYQNIEKNWAFLYLSLKELLFTCHLYDHMD